MKQFVLFLVVILLADISFGLPVTKVEEVKKEENEEHHEETPEDIESILEYERYLKEVVSALESDPDFRQKLDNASEIDVRSGKIAHELEYVNHHVRTKLDEIKRREIERLRLMAIKQYELSNDIDRDHLKIDEHKHIDHDNEHTFEIEDLKKLIIKTSQDLAEVDKQRRDDFKEYELQKEFEKQEKLRTLDEEHRKKYEEELQKEKASRNNHERVHHPGSKAQLEEVWEKKDHMDKADFNPITFFMTHDLDNNGQLDETELKAIFINDLDKAYKPGQNREREEEIERMREHVMNEVDSNRDRMVSLEELLAQTKREEFKKDPGWETVDQQPQFTHEEYMEFERRRQAEIQQLIAQGRLPAHPNMPNGYYPNDHGAAYQAAHPNQIQNDQGYQQQPHYQQPQQLHNQQNVQYQQQQQMQYQQQQYQQQQQQQYKQQQYQQQQYHNQRQEQPLPPIKYPQVQSHQQLPHEIPVPPNQQPIPVQAQGQPQLNPSNQDTLNVPQQEQMSVQVPISVPVPIPPQQAQVLPEQVRPELNAKPDQKIPALAIQNAINADPSAKQ